MTLKDEIISTIKKLEESKRLGKDCTILSNGELQGNIETILITHSDVAAFSLLEDHDTWKKTLSHFQDIYLKKYHSLWKNKNLELIYFSKDLTSEAVTKIEENKYFCRKFVLNQLQVEDEIERLPFVDFSLIGKNIKIYKDARETLSLYGVNQKLAEYLSQTGDKSARIILSDSLKDEYGAPTLKDLSQAELFKKIAGKQDASLSKLSNLKIRNFRAYKGEHCFDLNAPVIILFGPNGLGKTSFFDAIDFAMTGGTVQSERLFPKDIKKQKAPLCHLSSAEKDCSVEIAIKNEGEEDAFFRELISSKEVKRLKDGKKVPTDQFLMDIVSKTSIAASEINEKRIKNLFRATYLFGQELPELTEEIKSKGTIDTEILSRLIAFQDYVEVFKKGSEILEQVDKDKEKIEAVKLGAEKDLNQLKQKLPIPLTSSTDSAKLRPPIPANFVHSTTQPRSPLGDDFKSFF